MGISIAILFIIHIISYGIYEMYNYNFAETCAVWSGVFGAIVSLCKIVSWIFVHFSFNW